MPNARFQIMCPTTLFVLVVLLITWNVSAWQISKIKRHRFKINDFKTRHRYRLGNDDTQHQEKISPTTKHAVVNLNTLNNSTVKHSKKPYTYLDARKEIKRMYALRNARRKLMLLTGKTFTAKNPTAYFINIVNPLQTNTTRTPAAIVTNVEELRSAALDKNIELKDIAFRNVSFVASPASKHIASSKSTETIMDSEEYSPFDHEVMKLIKKRVKDNSKPGSRASDDKAHLALSIEGGGMRGAVSAGMASAIAVLGLSDVFDSIYGSSAGSVVGAYMVSRQMCIDVYTDVLTAAKTKFVSKGRLASSLAYNLFDHKVLNRSNMRNNTIFSNSLDPPMNISFVLDTIMDPEHGLRPLDLKTFGLNDKHQPLRIVTSAVRDGKMETHCLGSRNVDFFDRIGENGEVTERATTMLSGKRHGLFACLETSMTVPAATGPPLPMLRNKDAHLNIPIRCFDAFCYEPIPYRSAVKEGATHVMVLKTRPDGNPIGSKPGLFETIFAPTYFDGNGMPQVSNFFKKGGQQYIYIEDYLTLDAGKSAGPEGVAVPPTKILYGVEKDDDAKSLIQNRNEWKRAHLLPVAVPHGRPELSTLSVEQDQVLMAVRDGFAAAFDLLAPLANIQLKAHMTGQRAAELIFSNVGSFRDVLEKPMPTAGNTIYDQTDDCEDTRDFTMQSSHIKNEDVVDSPHRMEEIRDPLYFMDFLDPVDFCPKRDAHHLLNELPGFESGKMESLSRGLRSIQVKK